MFPSSCSLFPSSSSIVLVLLLSLLVCLLFPTCNGKEGVKEIKLNGLSVRVNEKLPTPQCLSDQDIIQNTKLSREELHRIRSNTKAILDGSFSQYATGSIGFDFYSNEDPPNQPKKRKDKGPSKVIVDTGYWPSIKLSTMVFALLLQDVLGYPTEVLDLVWDQYQTPFDRLVVGATHFYLQWWRSDDTGEFNQFVLKDQTVLDAGVQGYFGHDGFYVPTYLQKDNPFINHWRALKDPSMNKVFKRFDSKNFEEFFGKEKRKAVVDSFSCSQTWCPDGFFIPKQCEQAPTECGEFLVINPEYAYGIFMQLMTNLKLPFVIVLTGTDEFWDLVQDRLDKQEGILFPYWVPDLIDENVFLRVVLPDYSPFCYEDRVYGPEGSIDCDFPPNFMRRLAWGGAASALPSAYEFARRHQLTDLDLSVMINQFYQKQAENPQDTDEFQVACDWLRNNSHSWGAWIPVPSPAKRDNLPSWAVGLIIGLASLCICFSLIMWGLVFCFRKRTIMKYGDPAFIYFMIAGNTLSSVGVILNVVPNPTETYACQITVWMVCIGFTLFFGSLVTKTFRLVWVVFQVKQSALGNSFLFKKTHLVLIVGALLTIDSIILGVWTGFDTLKAIDIYSETNPLKYNTRCGSSHDLEFIVTLAVYKCLLIGITAIFAYLGRNLPNVLNESYFISLSVYNVALFTSVVLPVTAVLNDDEEAAILVRCIGFLVGGLVSVALLVLPKLWVIYKGQHGAAENDAVIDGLKVSKGTRQSSQSTDRQLPTVHD